MKKIAFLTLGLLLLVSASAAQNGREKAVITGPSHDGQEVTCDLYPQEQFRNVAARSNNAGCCVFTSVEHAARAQGIEELRGFRDFVANTLQGGGWPDRLDDYLAKWFAHKKINPIPYVQYEGKDPEKLLSLIDKTGRMACITYGWSERMGTGSHMVNATTFRGKWAVVLDNNYVAKKTSNGWDESAAYEWMSQAELCRRAKLTGGSAWIFVWLPPPPPPPARNAPAQQGET